MASTFSSSSSDLVHEYLVRNPLNCQPLPGALQAGRVHGASDNQIYVGATNQLHLIQTLYPSSPSITKGRQGPYISTPLSVSSCHTALIHQHNNQQQIVHVAGVKDDGESYRIASIDDMGHILISTITSQPSSQSCQITTNSTSHPQTSTGTCGWHGIAWKQQQLASASHWSRSLNLYDPCTLTSTRTCHTVHAPTSITWLTPDTLALTESNLLSIWDIRTQDACVQRQNVSKEILYAISYHEAGVLATGGADKMVTIHDPRKWTVAGSWARALKYEVTHLALSQRDPTYVYVTGLDHEIFCGCWLESESHVSTLKRHGFRGDSRWLGVDRISHDNSDTLVGMTETGHLYILQHPHRMVGIMSELPVRDSWSWEAWEQQHRQHEYQKKQDKKQHAQAQAQSKQQSLGRQEKKIQSQSQEQKAVENEKSDGKNSDMGVDSNISKRQQKRNARKAAAMEKRAAKIQKTNE